MSSEAASNKATNQELHVIFGTGPVGIATANALLKRGHQVRLVNRSGRASAPQGAEVIAADALNPVQTKEAGLKGRALSINVPNPPTPVGPKTFPRCSAPSSTPLPRLGPSSCWPTTSTCMVMWTAPSTKILPYAAKTRKGKVRAAMAKEALEAHKQGKLRVAIGRASDFYGPFVKESALGERVFEPLLGGQGGGTCW